MTKKEIKIVNFIYLNKEKLDQILKYRNQKFIREVSAKAEIITQAQHEKYIKKLKQKDTHFAFLITVDDKDYAVINYKKLDEITYCIGDYLVDELYKFEGGGIVSKACLLYVCNKIGAKFITYQIAHTNTRNFRSGVLGNVIYHEDEEGFFNEKLEVADFYSKEIMQTKPRKLFDKLYEIKEVML